MYIPLIWKQICSTTLPYHITTTPHKSKRTHVNNSKSRIPQILLLGKACFLMICLFALHIQRGLQHRWWSTQNQHRWHKWYKGSQSSKKESIAWQKSLTALRGWVLEVGKGGIAVSVKQSRKKKSLLFNKMSVEHLQIHRQHKISC